MPDNWDSALYDDRHSFVWQNSADPAPPEEATEPLTEVNLPAADGTQLVFIGYHAVRSRIAEQLATLTGRHWS